MIGKGGYDAWKGGKLRNEIIGGRGAKRIMALDTEELVVKHGKR